MEEFRPIYRHQRIPERLNPGKKGKPRWKVLAPYCRGMGFMSRVDSVTPILLGEKPRARGGTTSCLIINNAGIVVAVGRAICSLSDNFNYRIGREIALARATERFKQWIIVRELKEEIQVHGHC